MTCNAHVVAVVDAVTGVWDILQQSALLGKIAGFLRIEVRQMALGCGHPDFCHRLSSKTSLMATFAIVERRLRRTNRILVIFLAADAEQAAKDSSINNGERRQLALNNRQAKHFHNAILIFCT